MGKGIVYLVGAGPGDPGLITLKGLRCLQQADVVVYDRLASPRLLSFVREDAELIYAGKAPGRHSFAQEEINRILAEKAEQGYRVVRLKGGDPFVFGRGGEEASYLAERGIPFEVVPGVTSGIGVAAYAGIPVTHRDYSSTVALITGNEDPEKEDSSLRWQHLATGVDTLIFYMGMRNLPLIVKKLLEHGRAPETPVALVTWGTRPEQRTVTGTLADIEEKARRAGLSHPVIIVVGEVVRLREKLSWYEQKPLFGKRVLVARARGQGGSMAEKIEALGGEPWEFPTIAIAPPEDFGPLDAAISRLGEFDWVVFTSANGVEAFFGRMRELRVDIRALGAAKIIAIGPRTREAVEKYGLFCDLMPEEFVAEGIVAMLQEYDLKGKKFLLPRSDIARKALPQALAQMGAEVVEVPAYRTLPAEGNREELLKMLREKKLHVLTFTSSSTVRNFVRLLPENELPSLLEGVTVACIGPITAETAKELGVRVDVVASKYTVDGLLEALVDYFREG